ncbi:MAG TPA: hypothetical protein VLM88_01345 [Proteiniclasticum sp.]|nr:hypothetical protein [Proteiniclasticum sp.]
MTNHKRMLSILLVSTILFFGIGCSSNTQNIASSGLTDKYIVNIVNMSDELISEVQFQQNLSSGGGINADGSPLKHGDHLYFDFDNPDGGAIFSVLDEDKEILAIKSIPFSFDEQNQMTVMIENAEQGVELTVSSEK